VCVGLVCVSAPAIKPVIQRYAPGFMSSLSGGSYSRERYPNTPDRAGATKSYIRSGGRRTGAGSEFEFELRNTGDGSVNSNAVGHGFGKGGSGNFWGAGKREVDTESTEGVLPVMRIGDIVKSTSVKIEVEERADANGGYGSREYLEHFQQTSNH
jgi:hypothetical protein